MVEKRRYTRRQIELYRTIIVLGGILVNVAVVWLRSKLQIPLYLDTIGTIVVAGECGTLSGIVVALGSALLCASFRPMSMYFAMVHIIIAVCATIMFDKKVPRKKGGILLFVTVLTIVGGFFCSVVEWVLLDTSESFVVSDLTNHLEDTHGIPAPIAFFSSELVIHFFDKIITVVTAFSIMFLIPTHIKALIWEKKTFDSELVEGFDEDFDGKKRIGLRRALVITLAIEVIMLSNIIAGVSVKIYTESTRQERIAIAQGAAHLVVEAVDVSMLPYFAREGRQALGYKSTEALLYSIRDNVPYLKYVYIYKVTEEGYRIIFDLSSDDCIAGEPGDLEPFDEGIKPYISRMLGGYTPPPMETNDQYGWLLTVAEPIFDSDGKCLAYAFVDLSMSDLQVYIVNFLIRVYFIFTGFLILMLVLGVRMANNYHRIIDRQYKHIEEAREEADRANSAKSRFLANISHEIRTPINTIMGMDEMILREEIDGVPKEYATTVTGYARDIKRASELLLDLVNDVLDLSKVESGKMNLVEVEYDVADSLKSIITMIQVRNANTKLYFDLDLDPKLPSILYGDGQKLKQVIINLLTNAMKYTQEGGFMLKIQMEEKTSDTCKVFIAVGDTGIGVKSEDIDKLFTPYDRLDEKKNNAIQGTGLGLNLSKQFVELMGSELKCDSVYGEGSTFYFTIEQKIVDATPVGDFMAKEEAPVRSDYVPLFLAPRGKVLVVDDNEMNREVIRGLLKQTKLQVTTVSGGRECLAKLKEESFHVVLLDHMMPDMDGIETLEELRKTHPKLPTIVLTANAANDGGNYYRSLGFNDYLAKPVKGELLEELLAKYLPVDVLEKVDEKEYAKEKETDRLPKEYEWLNDARGISVEKGIEFCGGGQALVKSITTFYETLEENAKEIEKAFHEEDYEFYTIKVHALKSSARIIGATELSKMAEKAEEAGKDHNISYIQENTKELLDTYLSYKEKLEGLSKKKEKDNLPPVPKAELEEALEALEELISSMDYDGVEMVLEEMGHYKQAEDDEVFFDRMKKAWQKFDWDAMEELQHERTRR